MISAKDLAEIIHEEVYTINSGRHDEFQAIDPDDLICALIVYFKRQDDNGVCEFDEEEFIEDCGGFYN